MEHAAVIGFGTGLLLICLFWVYGYIRRRARRPSDQSANLTTNGDD